MHKSSKIDHQILGHGPCKVIVSHDWMGDTSGNWKHALDYFDKDFSTIAFMDVRGYGRSKERLGQYTLDEIVADFFDLADQLGWERFHLVGHSMSGMAAQKAALSDSNDRIISVVAITPVSSAGFPVDEETKQFFEAIITDKTCATQGYGMLTGEKLSPQWAMQRTDRLHDSINATAMKKYMTEWSTQNFYEDTKGLKTPFKVIFGKDDLEPWQEAGQRQAFQFFENVQFCGLDNAGHYPMEQVPARTVRILEDHLRQFH